MTDPVPNGPLPRRTVARKLWKKRLLEREQEVNYPALIPKPPMEFSTKLWREKALDDLKKIYMRRRDF